MRTPLFVVCVFLCLAAGLARADDLPRAEPEAVGLSPTELAKIDAAVERRIASKAIAGAVTVVARHGKVAYLRAFGAFEEDTIFRIYSMTKPVTVAAALTLVDEGKLSLDDPVSKYIPAFAKLTVHGSDVAPPVMTVRHLMQHTSGLTYGFFGNTPVDRMYRAQGVLDRDSTLAEATDKLAAIPLLFAPGSRWHYGVSTDLLGRIIEIVSEQALDAFFAARIFEPLGMKDTGFFVPPASAARLAANYNARGAVMEAPETSPYLAKPGLLSGGGGLVSTARDFTIFALMLANGGAWNGKRILETETVETMTTNQLPEALVPIRFGPLPLPGTGFGLGVSVRVGGESAGRRIGEWGWGGAASTTFVVSPKDDLVIVTLLQRMPMWSVLDQEIRPIVYGAIQEPAAVR